MPFGVVRGVGRGMGVLDGSPGAGKGMGNFGFFCPHWFEWENGHIFLVEMYSTRA